MSISTFYPALSNITGITNSAPAVITFSAPHDFTSGEYISFRSSAPYGMTEINELRGLVLSTTPTTVTVNLDTTNFRSFVYPPVGKVVYPAIAVPSGSGPIPASDPVTINLEDAFDNIPPN